MPNLADELPTIASSTDDPHSTAPALTPEDVFSTPHPPHPARRRRRSRLALPLMFCLGIAAAIAWDSFGGRIRETLAATQMSWMPRLVEQLSLNLPPQHDAAAEPAAPAAGDQQQPSAVSQDLDTVRQSVERIAAAQDQIIRSIGQLSAGQEQISRDIAKLQAVEQYILYKNPETPPAATTAAAPAAPAAPARAVPVRRTPPAAAGGAAAAPTQAR